MWFTKFELKEVVGAGTLEKICDNCGNVGEHTLAEAIRFFHTACTQGSGCTGEPVLAFKLDELLETKMTDSGESLAKLLNMSHIKPMLVVEVSHQANPSTGLDEEA